MNSTRIAVIGSANMDLVTYVDRMPRPGETLAARAFETGHGGKGANQAIAAARLGSAVSMVACVGDDAFADQTLANFNACGVDTTHVRRVEGASTGVASIMVEPGGENVILIVDSANGDLAPADVEAAAPMLAEASLILLQLEVPLPTVYAAIEWGRKNGVPTILNPAPAHAELDLARIAAVRFLTPNETELALLTGLPVETDAEVEAAARDLVSRGIETVIVTRGARGVTRVTRDETRAIPSVPVETVDTTGAGDAFIGAFASFHASGDDVDTALARAARYAADTTTRRGAQKAYATLDAFTRAGG